MTYREAAGEEATLAPSPATTLVFKMVKRKAVWLEEWIHPGLNIDFLDFDEEQSLELGVGVAMTIYKDFFEVGYGRNPTIREDPWYWYFGLNVVKFPTKRSEPEYLTVCVSDTSLNVINPHSDLSSPSS